MAEKAVDSDGAGITESDSDTQPSVTAFGRQAERDAVIKALEEAKRSADSGIPALDPEKQAALDDLRTDTKLKKLYARWFIGILIAQLLAMNFIFVAVGLEWLKYPESVINLFMGGTLGEVFGVVLVITKYLFTKR